jgi:TolB protein
MRGCASGVVRQVCLVAVGLVVLSGAVALASVPGKNGRIAFRRYLNDAHTRGAIFTINADGSGEVGVTHPPKGSFDDQPDWSPSGSLLVFARCATDSVCSIYTVRPDGSGLKRLSPACPAGAIPPRCEDDNNMAFTPDGKHVTFTRSWGTIKKVPGGDQIQHSDIVIVDLAGGHRRTLLASDPFAADLNYAAFSPDGKRLVYEHSNSPLSKPPGRKALFVASASGKADHRITPWSLDAGDNPDWSPDGQWIVFRSHVSDDRNSNIYLVHPDGSGLRQLTHFKRDANVRSACFSPDGQSIVLGTDNSKGGNPDVYVMKTDGTDLHAITHNPLWDSAADWGTSAS